MPMTAAVYLDHRCLCQASYSLSLCKANWTCHGNSIDWLHFGFKLPVRSTLTFAMHLWLLSV